MSISPVEILRHILDEADFLLQQSQGLDKEKFLQDETLKRAFARSIEVIGEASKQLSTEIRDRYPQIEWRAVSGMRNRLIHSYFSIDYEIVWDVVDNKIPDLRQEVERMIEEETRHEGACG
ncbi:MAG: DUF86 domain-containing protein [Planctomycetes bacterium]|nr:DUF86 domain-containing protein [Planctomycetota bacterium]